MPRRFFVLDVFTNQALAGNPLAVVLDAEGLSDARMQAIAREFNLSETVFVLPPENPAHSARLRIYRVANDQVRAAGVHRLTIANASPQPGNVDLGGHVLRFPYTVSAGTNQTFPGLTYGYGGQEERGAVLTGLDDDAYPYRKVGDSIRWTGTVRADLPVEYHLRMLYYSDESARVGGVVLISLSGQ